MDDHLQRVRYRPMGIVEKVIEIDNTENFEAGTVKAIDLLSELLQK